MAVCTTDRRGIAPQLTADVATREILKSVPLKSRKSAKLKRRPHSTADLSVEREDEFGLSLCGYDTKPDMKELIGSFHSALKSRWSMLMMPQYAHRRSHSCEAQQLSAMLLAQRPLIFRYRRWATR
jgi:hypothetical protein